MQPNKVYVNAFFHDSEIIFMNWKSKIFYFFFSQEQLAKSSNIFCSTT